jgi:hypothetical protein
MRKISVILTLLALAAMSSRADILFQDSTNYPYVNGPINGQGQWYIYSPATAANQSNDVMVVNDNLILSTNENDSVATPTNGWLNETEYNFVGFQINVSKVPADPNGSYFCQLQTTNDGVSVAHLFIDTLGTVVPGTYRLGIGNYATSFGGAYGVPANLPLDLVTNVTYTVVLAWDADESSAFFGATLYVDPSGSDGPLSEEGNVTGPSFIYPTDDVPSPGQQNIPIYGPGAASQVAFSHYVNASIGNVVAANTFAEVNTTNPPVFGVEPLSGNYYSGNSETLYAIAAGSDMTYQWYDSHGALTDDGVNFVGSTSNILTILNLTSSDSYYVVATDAYGNSVTSQTAVSTVNTTPTPPFFTSLVPLNVTNNLFLTAGFNNAALGTGPLNYQWYHETLSNGVAITPFAALAGQTSPAINLDLVDYTFNGLYYVQVTSALGTAFGPTNSITEIAPVVASLAQLHALALSLTNVLASNPYINQNNVTISGYVAFNGGYGGSSYDEFMVQDTNGNGIAVYLKDVNNGNIDDSNTPPFGASVTVQGSVQVYNGTLEIDPVGVSAVTVSNLATAPISPHLANPYFNEFAINGKTNFFDPSFLNLAASIVTLTNVYIYTNHSAPFGPPAQGLTFPTTGGTLPLYCTIGQYDATTNNHYWEIYQRCPLYGGVSGSSQFGGQQVPAYCSELTAAFVPSGSSPEIIPSRLADYVTYTPINFPVGLISSNKTATITWPAVTGQTYTLLTSTNLSSPWTKVISGLGYIPSNGSYLETKNSPAKFYQLTTP